jgi:hypothetical protein
VNRDHLPAAEAQWNRHLRPEDQIETKPVGGAQHLHLVPEELLPAGQNDRNSVVRIGEFVQSLGPRRK